MKIFIPIIALVGAQQEPPTFQPQPPAEPTPAVTTTTTTLPPTISAADRCNNNNDKKINFYNQDGPKPSSGAMCPNYECASCCNDEKAQAFFNPLMTADGNLKQHGMYNFAGCSGSSQNTDKTGHVSAKCQGYLTQNFCLSSCSPNVYLYKKKGPADRKHDMRVCSTYCDEFYNACKDEYVCFNANGLLEYITDALTGVLDEHKEYKLFSCSGSYECKKLSDTRVAQPVGKDQLAQLVKAKCEGNKNPDLEICKKDYNDTAIPSELFCSRFTFGLLKYSTEALCIDPANEQTVIAQVQGIEAALNKNGEKVKYVTTPVCETGLSGGAIAGIVIGVLAGIGLIAGLVWYFACRSKGGDDDDYTQGKQTDTEQAGSHSMSPKEVPNRDESIVRSEADYDPSRSASAK